MAPTVRDKIPHNETQSQYNSTQAYKYKHLNAQSDGIFIIFIIYPHNFYTDGKPRT